MRKEPTANATANIRELKRTVGDSLKQLVEFMKKAIAQSYSLSFVMRCRFFNVLLCTWFDL